MAYARLYKILQVSQDNLRLQNLLPHCAIECKSQFDSVMANYMLPQKVRAERNCLEYAK